MNSDLKPEVALIGNPNCGKTTLFNQITGLNKKTGNWSGVTVDTQFCAVNFDQLNYHLIDLPGIYALSLEGQGQDETHVQEFLQKQPPDLIINVVNSASLERGLFMTVELLEYGVPVITVLNMWDEAQKLGLIINCEELSKQLNSPVIPVVAKTGDGVDTLLKHVNSELNKNSNLKPFKIDYLNPTWAALLGAGISMGLSAIGSGYGGGMAGGASCEGIARNPETVSSVTTIMLVGQAVTQTPCIFGLLVSFILIFKAFPETTALSPSMALLGAGISMGFGGLGPGIGNGMAAEGAVRWVARNVKHQSELMRTMLVGQAVSQSTAIYAMVISLVLIFVV